MAHYRREQHAAAAPQQSPEQQWQMFGASTSAAGAAGYGRYPRNESDIEEEEEEEEELKKERDSASLADIFDDYYDEKAAHDDGAAERAAPTTPTQRSVTGFAGPPTTYMPHSPSSPQLHSNSNSPQMLQHGSPFASGHSQSHHANNMTPSSSWHGHTRLGSAFSAPINHAPASSNEAIARYAAENMAPSRHSMASSRPMSGLWAPNPVSLSNLRQRKAFQSRMVLEGQAVEKPWLESKQRRTADRRAYWVFVCACMLGLAAAGVIMWLGIRSIPYNDKYCLVMDEQFEGDSLDPTIWHHELETGGFGNGEFEWTTNSPNNSYVKDGQLYIVPTLTSDQFGEAAIYDGATLNLTTTGECTSTLSDPEKRDAACAVMSNSTAGVILPPIQSARITTNFSRTIRYGRVEVRAKMPTGDWIWPAVWMMPKDSVYGPWPRSGEIDIFEGKGNMPTSRQDVLANAMRSTLHWGPVSGLDRYWLTDKVRRLLRNYYNQRYHTFGMEWTEEGIYTWSGTRAYKTLSYKFDTAGFWEKGEFPAAATNGSAIYNPWGNRKQAPFDQDFFLILNVAVGGTNGYFYEEDKPWSNSADADTARADFWAARNSWWPTWGAPEERAMIVDYVKMWQKC